MTMRLLVVLVGLLGAAYALDRGEATKRTPLTEDGKQGSLEGEDEGAPLNVTANSLAAVNHVDFNQLKPQVLEQLRELEEEQLAGGGGPSGSLEPSSDREFTSHQSAGSLAPLTFASTRGLSTGSSTMSSTAMAAHAAGFDKDSARGAGQVGHLVGLVGGGLGAYSAYNKYGVRNGLATQAVLGSDAGASAVPGADGGLGTGTDQQNPAAADGFATVSEYSMLKLRVERLEKVLEEMKRKRLGQAEMAGQGAPLRRMVSEPLRATAATQALSAEEQQAELSTTASRQLFAADAKHGAQGLPQAAAENSMFGGLGETVGGALSQFGSVADKIKGAVSAMASNTGQDATATQQLASGTSGTTASDVGKEVRAVADARSAEEQPADFSAKAPKRPSAVGEHRHKKIHHKKTIQGAAKKPAQ